MKRILMASAAIVGALAFVPASADAQGSASAVPAPWNFGRRQAAGGGFSGGGGGSAEAGAGLAVARSAAAESAAAVSRVTRLRTQRRRGCRRSGPCRLPASAKPVRWAFRPRRRCRSSQLRRGYDGRPGYGNGNGVIGGGPPRFRLRLRPPRLRQRYGWNRGSRLWLRLRRLGLGLGLGLAGGSYYGGGYGYPGYGYGGYYDNGYYAPAGYYGTETVVEAAPARDDEYCARRFKTYDPATGTYIGKGGVRRSCP